MSGMKGTRIAGPAAAAAAILALAVAAEWSLRVGWADYVAQPGTLEAFKGAVRWSPAQSAYQYRLGVLAEEKDPAGAMAALRQAAALDPTIRRGHGSKSGCSWRRTGRRMPRSAACCTRRTWTDVRAAVDAGQLLFPAKRHGEVLEVGGIGGGNGLRRRHAVLPALRTCGGRRTVDRASWNCRPEVRLDYLSYLVSHGPLEAILPAVRKVMEEDRKADVPMLVDACDRLLDNQRAADALEVWNRLAQKRDIPLGTVGADAGSVLTNGTFASAPSSRGFDWRLPAVDGVSASGEEKSGGLRLTFSGSEPERCEVLGQFLPLRENTPYELKFTYRTSGIEPGAGLRWRVVQASGGGNWRREKACRRKIQKRSGSCFGHRRGSGWPGSHWNTGGPWAPRGPLASSYCAKPISDPRTKSAERVGMRPLHRRHPLYTSIFADWHGPPKRILRDAARLDGDLINVMK